MKFALQSKVYLIHAFWIDDMARAISYIQKMYSVAYGPRAGTVRADRLTPNEERLIAGLRERFSTLSTLTHLSIAVDCGNDTFVFVSKDHDEVEGLWLYAD